MKLLALDTSTETCSVALRVGDAVRVARHPGARQQTAAVLPLVQALLAEAGLALRELDAIACTLGPGAFTGVRVAVSVTQGLAFGAGLPVIGISTLATLAQQAEAPHALALLDARMGELYAGFYARGADGLVDALAPDCLLPPAQLAAAVPALPAGAAWTAIGSGWAAYPELVVAPRTGAARVAEPDAPAVLALAARALARGEAIAPEQLVPAYLRDNVTWKKVGEQGRA